MTTGIPVSALQTQTISFYCCWGLHKRTLSLKWGCVYYTVSVCFCRLLRGPGNELKFTASGFISQEIFHQNNRVSYILFMISRLFQEAELFSCNVINKSRPSL